MQIETPYLMFLGDVPDRLAAKTAYGIKDWRPEWCVGQLRLPGCAAGLHRAVPHRYAGIRLGGWPAFFRYASKRNWGKHG